MGPAQALNIYILHLARSTHAHRHVGEFFAHLQLSGKVSRRVYPISCAQWIALDSVKITGNPDVIIILLLVDEEQNI